MGTKLEEKRVLLLLLSSFTGAQGHRSSLLDSSHSSATEGQLVDRSQASFNRARACGKSKADVLWKGSG